MATFGDMQPWAYRDTCLCDTNFLDWLDGIDRLAGPTILHMGTGLHHSVGLWARANHAYVLGLTASWGELAAYKAYVQSGPVLLEHYAVLLADIWRLPCILLPEFDIITLFHIGEFPEAEVITNAELLSNLYAHLAPGGKMIFYEGSSGFGRVRADVEAFMQDASLEIYKSLAIYTLR